MSELVSLSCPSCGSAVIENDIFCRNCGVRLLGDDEDLIRRGRNIVIFVAIISLSIEYLGYIADPSPNYLSYFIRLSIEIVILYLIYRGYSFARWLLAIAGIIGCLRGVFYLTIMNFSNFDFYSAGLVVMTALCASVAGLLLIPRSVRAFQKAKMNSPKMGSISGQ